MRKSAIPIYVSRQTGAGYTGQFALYPWLYGLICWLVTANVVGWSAFGLVTLGEKAVNYLG